ncbi:DUF2063 domain-containing protein [Psychromonas sp. psych-6C06]|uniref:HvfC/BufC N-terminal domain-containing protein n=1 Tax=Psychromonas sp. psych-6C06 TaxID=2058089 RepID=UPI000C34F30E|nr:DNA-binding domain-containing protein [Psychromonas sp. psych-6C06]PKF62566.1 DUF2063 domain-containing protein [Psychromonas sp. psych-6C06]
MKLKQLQTQFADSLFYEGDAITESIKTTQQISPDQRLQIYRNSFIMGVTEALVITYQHTSSLVGEDFFNAVCRTFILQNPPKENNIITYGKGFSCYLSALPQLQSMPYISEMARFEWALEQTCNTPVSVLQLDLEKLGQLTEDNLANLTFSTPTQITLFESEQNIALLYEMLIAEQVQETDLNTPCYLVLKKQPDFKIELISLDKLSFRLLQQIQAGKTLAEISRDGLEAQLPHLLEQALLNGFTIK